jgi:hypothetical protein
MAINETASIGGSSNPNLRLRDRERSQQHHVEAFWLQRSSHTATKVNDC